MLFITAFYMFRGLETQAEIQRCLVPLLFPVLGEIVFQGLKGRETIYLVDDVSLTACDNAPGSHRDTAVVDPARDITTPRHDNAADPLGKYLVVVILEGLPGVPVIGGKPSVER